MKDRLEVIAERYNQISEMLLDMSVVSDIKKLTALSKEQKSLEKIVIKYKELQTLENNIVEAKELLHDSDPEIKEMAEFELEESKTKLDEVTQELKILLIPKDPNDEKNVIMEIRGAAGGDEGNIFAGDLYRMYVKYAEAKGWKIEVVDSLQCEAGGFSQISFMVYGDSVYSFLKYESGSHRVQRVPSTESSGRIHTSTATVLVMPEADEIEVNLDMNDVRIDTFCASGPGGQCVNTTKSAIRVTHIPTGIVVSCQDGKSQHENKASALKVLQARLYDHMLQEKEAAEGAERLSKVGRGDRSEKIRTYNYPQNRVTDHRIGFTIQQLDRIMEGRIDPVIDALIAEDQKKQLSVEEN